MLRIFPVPLFFVLCTVRMASGQSADELKFFETKVRPLLATQCQGCHSSKSKMAFGGLRIDQKASFFQGGQSGALVVPGKPDESLLLKVVGYSSELKMPPTGKLKAEQIDVLREWIQMGAPWPEEAAPVVDASVAIQAKTKAAALQHWAWKPVAKVTPPKTKATDWSAQAIDQFILAKLEEKKLKPSPDADRQTLLRRVYFDLAGLPPTPKEVNAFVADKSPKALETIVDRLLAAPSFGERWGRHWLDLSYFADNLEIGRKIPAKDAWRYRDYVIRSLNADKPFTTFIKEQLAGDLLPAESDAQRREQVIATGFLALGPWTLVAADKEQLRMDVVDMQVDLIGKAFLGLTVGCARCHDHKFDPISHKDYYAMAGILGATETLHGRIDGIFSDVNRIQLPESVEELRMRAGETEKFHARMATLKPRLKALEAEKEKLKKAQPQGDATPKPDDPLVLLEKQIAKLSKEIALLEYNRPLPPEAFAVRDVDAPVNAHINIRGNPHMLGEEVPRSFLQVAMWDKPPVLAYRASGRLELAEWIANEKNPLTARVAANRVWQHLFGAGLVRSVDNFGLRGELPTHPELLDYLATRYVEAGWSLKKVVREVILSRAYRQSSAHNAEAYQVDPENLLRWRMNRRRMEGEIIRDSILSLTRTLENGEGGPTLPLDIADNLNLGKPVEFRDEAKLPDHLLRLRTVYLPVLRKSQHRSVDILNLFDFPDVNQVNGARSVTTVPTQALYLMNSPFYQEQSKLLAARAIEFAGTTGARIDWLTEQVLGRSARPDDQTRGNDFISKFSAALVQSGKTAPEANIEAWTRYCHALLASNEFLYIR
ncbi:PSD1 and planctomycete cytochrome C domain-containing protein [Bryobacter aggregatus]|uniref:PSD1 and planctomycete cytochrome C domain-containing protein n=1 Tax=Bryobacter aggregatus TaxID=360054 RepID=UPI00138E1528|nr:PSD1 and planctomycete cytochrome C domain-containing protein [Bryobacter aggregatus]